MTRGRRRARRERDPDRGLVRYLEHLREDRGLTDHTLSHHRTGVRDFLAFLDDRGILLQDLKIEDVDAYLGALAAAGKSRSVLQYRAIAVRGFLRFLAAEGALPWDFSGWVEAPRSYRDSTVPPHFSWQQVEQLLAAVEGESAVSLRDRAMLAVLCVYGLRSQEVVGLTLDDIDSSHDQIRIVERKGGRPLVLPLIEVVKVTLERYLDGGRPQDTPHRQVFLSRRGLPLRSTAVSCSLKRLTLRAGLGDGRGAHALRRAVGTRLVEQGWGLGEVTQVLGQDSIDSARVYLRLSTQLLRDVADNYAELL